MKKPTAKAAAAIGCAVGVLFMTGAAFADVPNLVLTPHIAGGTDESNVRVSAVTAEAVARHLGA